MDAPAEDARTAVQEAGHAVLQWVLGIGLERVSIVPDEAEQTAGHAVHGGEFAEADSDADNLRIYAEDAFWLRHAIACYAGAEAVRQIRPEDDADTGAGADERAAVQAICHHSPETAQI